MDMKLRRNDKSTAHLQRRELRFECLEYRRLLSVNQSDTIDLSPSDLLHEATAEFGSTKDGAYSKFSTSLVRSLAEFHSLEASKTEQPSSANAALLQVEDSLVAVDLFSSTDSASLMNDLSDLGIQEMTSFERVVSARIPWEVLPAVAKLDSVQFASAVVEPIANVGLTTSQADVALNADDARATFGVDGTGITIGVLSDSFDSLNGYATDISTGDLPAGVNVLSDIGNGSDEGRAMAQLIFDVAPGADLAFHTAFAGVADFAQGIIDLANAGSDVIVDDVIYFAEPMFQDGIIAQAIETVVASGVSYFSSAGNNGRDSYESAFVDSGTELTIGGQSQGVLHDFDPGAGVDFRQSLTIPTGASVSLSFQWDQPYFSAGGAGAASDYDIYLVADNSIVASSIDNNIGGDPVEILSFENDGQFGTSQFDLLISRFSGPDAGVLKYVRFDSGNISVDEYDTASPTSYGHANAAGAQSVGAAFFGQTPEFGQDPALLESFSSAGGIPILFDSTGNPLAVPDVRANPAIVAPDGTNTTFFGFDIGSDPDSFPNFFGTSAAAPHAAAVAALVLEADPSLTPSELYGLMQSTAADMGAPGFDFETGFGLIDAFDAVAAASFDLGDTDQDGDIDADDIDFLFANLGSSLPQFDIDQDGGNADNDDVTELVEVILGTVFGDANLDGKVDGVDFSALSENIFGPGGWADGNFNGDSIIDFLDFSFLSENFGFDNGSLTAASQTVANLASVEFGKGPGTVVTSGINSHSRSVNNVTLVYPERAEPERNLDRSNKVVLQLVERTLPRKTHRAHTASPLEAAVLADDSSSSQQAAIDAVLEGQNWVVFK